MPKLLLLISILFSVVATRAQDSTFSAEDQALLDSMLKNDAFLKMLEDEPVSYADINVGFSNGVFSLKNNSLNAGQAETKKIFYTASAGYFHKSGVAVSVNGFFANDGGQLKMYQYAINPSYNYLGKKITAGISYTRFIDGAPTSFNVNPFKNDFYGNIVFNKLWWRPGVALGYASGKFTDYYDSTFIFTPEPPSPPRSVRITDTIVTKLRNFSITLSASHKWQYYNVFKKGDGVTIQPSVLLNISNQQFNITHSNSILARRPIVQKLLKAAYGDGTTKEPFRIQSLAIMLDAGYDIGRFNFAPQLYIDYYFPETTGNRFSLIYSLTASCAF